MTPRLIYPDCLTWGLSSTSDSTLYHGNDCVVTIMLLFSWTRYMLWLQLSGSSSLFTPGMMATLLSAGPVLLAQLMANITDKTRRSVLYPFHRDGWGTLSGHLVISVLTCVLPVYILAHMALSQPGEAAYFYVWK